jgi:hypothetical protein
MIQNYILLPQLLPKQSNKKNQEFLELARAPISQLNQQTPLQGENWLVSIYTHSQEVLTEQM